MSVNDHEWTFVLNKEEKLLDLDAGVGDAVADEAVVALACGAVIDLDEILVDGLVVVALDE